MSSRYPLLQLMGAVVREDRVKPDEFEKLLTERGISPEEFEQEVLGQTRQDSGMYAWDVEAALWRMMEKRKPL